MLTSMLARSASVGIAMVVTALAIAGHPSTASAAASGTSISSAAPLTQGVGMRAQPSVRVRRLQRVLERAGFDVGAPGADGRFGPLTAAAVRRMQQAYGLVADGIVGPKTRRVVALIAEHQRARRQRSQNPDRPRRGERQTPSATPRQPAGTSSRPAPARRPAVETGPARTEGADTTFATIAAVIAALTAAAALVVALLRGRRSDDRGPRVVPVGGDLYLEGQSDDEQAGAFRGYALAVELAAGERGAQREARYLVHDPSKRVPVWVRSTDVRRSPRQLAAGAPVIGYVTVERQGAPTPESLLAIESVCDRAGWNLREIVHDDDTGTVLARPGLTYALEQISGGHARGLVVGDAKRLAPSLSDLGALLKWFRDAEAVLILPDLGIDTATAEGAQLASTLISLSSWEPERAPSRHTGGMRAVPESRRTGASS